MQTSIKCPRCGAMISANIEQLIDVARDPAAKNRLLQGQINVVQCPACGFQGSLASPLVYHDPIKELLLTFFPQELNVSSMEQEQVLGRLTQQVVQALPPELRKGYLLRPQSMLTMQGLVERILEADGITKEMLEEQRAKSVLVRNLLDAEPAAREALIAENDSKIDATVLSLLGAYGRAASAQGDEASAQKIHQVREDVLRLSTAGKRATAQRLELEKAAQELEALGDTLSQDNLLQLIVAAPSLDRVTALASLAWQGMDYTFFQKLSDRADRATGAERERLTSIRDRALMETERIRQAVASEMAQASNLLQSVLQAPDIDRAIDEYLPEMNDLFFAVLETNLDAARREKREEIVKQLEDVKTRILAVLEKTLPADMRLMRDLLQQETDEGAEALLTEHAGEITDELISAMKTTLEDMRGQSQEKAAARLEKILQSAEKKRAMARFGAA